MNLAKCGHCADTERKLSPDRPRQDDKDRMFIDDLFGCPPGIRTPISRSRICCPAVERGGNSVSGENYSGILILGAEIARVNFFPYSESQIVETLLASPYVRRRELRSLCRFQCGDMVQRMRPQGHELGSGNMRSNFNSLHPLDQLALLATRCHCVFVSSTGVATSVSGNT